MPHVARITLRPVKGLDGVEVVSARVLPSGALEGDRRWRLVDADGEGIDERRHPALHSVRADFDLDAGAVVLRIDPAAGGGPAADRLPLVPGPSGPCPWLAEVLGREVFLQERPATGFPDIADAPGPVVAASASLESVATWFGLPVDDVRRRARIGVELADCDAFWEDTLACPARAVPPPSLGATLDLPADPWGAAPPPEPVWFAVGTARWGAVAVRGLDAVAARDPATGAIREGFREVFEAWRRRRLRRDVDASAWDGPYRLGVTTVGDGHGGEMAVGDPLALVAHPDRV